MLGQEPFATSLLAENDHTDGFFDEAFIPIAEGGVRPRRHYRELIDSARVDGASDARGLFSIVLPLSRAELAVISLFYAVGIWNSFFNAILSIQDPAKWPMQVILQQIVLEGTSLNASSVLDPSKPLPPPVTVEMEVVVVATVPIPIVYPFLQKYFMKGVLTRAIKG